MSLRPPASARHRRDPRLRRPAQRSRRRRGRPDPARQQDRQPVTQDRQDSRQPLRTHRRARPLPGRVAPPEAGDGAPVHPPGTGPCQRLPPGPGHRRRLRPAARFPPGLRGPTIRLREFEGMRAARAAAPPANAALADLAASEGTGCQEPRETLTEALMRPERAYLVELEAAVNQFLWPGQTASAEKPPEVKGT